MTGIPNNGSEKERLGLEEFEIGSATGLAPFEEESTILLDEFTTASPNLLEEFEETYETIHIDELLGSITQGDEEEPQEEPDPDESAPSVEPSAPEGEADESGDEEDAEPEDEGDEVEQVEAEPPEVVEEPPPKEPEEELEPLTPVVGFVCEHAVDLPELMDLQGRMNGRPIAHLVALPCAGMVKPSWLELALDQGASGVFVIACEPGSCHHRTGSCILEERWIGKRRPMLKSRVDRERVRLFQFHRPARDELLGRIDAFLAELGKLDRPSVAVPLPEKDKVGEEEIFDFPM